MSDIIKSYLYLIQIGVITLLTFITLPIIANFLTPSEFGVIALAQVYSVILMGMLNLGLVTGYERNYFQYEKNLKKTGELLNSVFLLVAFLAVVTSVIIFIFRDYIAELILNNKEHGNLLMLIFGGEVFFSLSQYFLQYLKLKGLAIDYIKITILRSVTYTILILLFLIYYKFGAISIGYAILLSSLLMFLTVIIQQIIRFPLVFNTSITIEALRLSLPLVPRTFFGFLNTQFDKIMLGALSTMSGVGVYSIGQKVSSVAFSFMTALDHVFIPSVYQSLFSDDKEIARSNIADYLLPFFYVSIFITLLIVLFIEEFFLLMMPDSYYDAINIVQILCIYYASMFFGKITGTLLIFSKKTFIISLLTLSSIVINVVLNLPMIYAWGAVGAAWATTFAGIINVLISFKISKKYCSIGWRWDAIIPITSIFFVAVFWSLISRSILVDMYEFRLIGKLVLVTCFIAIGVYFDLITKNNINKLLLPFRKSNY